MSLLVSVPPAEKPPAGGCSIIVVGCDRPFSVLDRAASDQGGKSADKDRPSSWSESGTAASPCAVTVSEVGPFSQWNRLAEGTLEEANLEAALDGEKTERRNTEAQENNDK